MNPKQIQLKLVEKGNSQVSNPPSQKKSSWLGRCWKRYKSVVDRWLSPSIDVHSVISGGGGATGVPVESMTKLVGLPAVTLAPIAGEQVIKQVTQKIPQAIKEGSIVDVAEEFCKIGFYSGLTVATVGITAESLSKFSTVAKSTSTWSFWSSKWLGNIPLSVWLLRLKIPVLLRTVYNAWRLQSLMTEALDKGSDQSLSALLTQLKKEKKILRRFRISQDTTPIDQKVINVAKKWLEEKTTHTEKSREEAKEILKDLSAHLSFHFWKDMGGLAANACWGLNKVCKFLGYEKMASIFEAGQGVFFLAQEVDSRHAATFVNQKKEHQN